MDSRLASIQERVNEALHGANQLCYAVRASELQEEAVRLLLEVKGDVARLKLEFLAERDEPSANLLLAIELVLDAFIEELRMWISIKEDHMGDAWDHLVDAQTAIATALKVHEAAASFVEYGNKLAIAERILFPSQMFMSAGMIVRQSKCSICGEDYDTCDHIKGKAYMGNLCTRVITECDLEEASIVENPANRHCRVVRVGNGETIRDALTWREVQSGESR